MKKIFKALIVLLVIIGLAACADMTNDESVELSNYMFEGFRIELTDVQSLALIQTNTNQSMVSLSTDNPPLFTNLVSIDQNGQQRLVYFTSQTRQLNQDDFEGWITKLHITDRFIIFMVSTLPTTRLEYTGIDYDRSGFLSDENNQTFLIDRSDGLIYSLSAFPIISSISGNVINLQVDDDHTEYHLLSLDDGQITFTNLMPNPNIHVFNVFEFGGYVFVINSMYDEIDGQIIYTRHGRWSVTDCGILLKGLSVYDLSTKETVGPIELVPGMIITTLNTAGLSVGIIWCSAGIFGRILAFYDYRTDIHEVLENSITRTTSVFKGLSYSESDAIAWRTQIRVRYYGAPGASPEGESPLWSTVISSGFRQLGDHIITTLYWDGMPSIVKVINRDSLTYDIPFFAPLIENISTVIDKGTHLLVTVDTLLETKTYIIYVGPDSELVVEPYDSHDFLTNSILIIKPIN